MSLKEFRALSIDQKFDKLKALKEELFNLRFQHATGQLENPMRIRQVKRSIAQINTIITEDRKEAFS